MAVDGPVPGDIRQGDHRIDLGKKVMKQKKMCSNMALLAGRFAVLSICEWICCVLRVCCIFQSSVL